MNAHADIRSVREVKEERLARMERRIEELEREVSKLRGERRASIIRGFHAA